MEALWQAVQKKYSPPKDALNPTVLAAEWVDGDGDGGGDAGGEAAARRRTRVVDFATTGLPYLLRRAAGVGDRLRVSEAYEWSPATRTLAARVENASDRQLAVFLELAAFEPCPRAPASATRMTSWVQVASDCAAGRSLLRLLPEAQHPAALLAKHVECLHARAAAAAAAPKTVIGGV